MGKNATVWKPLSGQGDVTNDNADDFLLLEDSGHILQENGDDLLLEETVVTPKRQTVWSDA